MNYIFKLKKQEFVLVNIFVNRIQIKYTSVSTISDIPKIFESLTADIFKNFIAQIKQIKKKD